MWSMLSYPHFWFLVIYKQGCSGSFQAWRLPEHRLDLPLLFQACGWRQLRTGWWFSAMHHCHAGGGELQALQQHRDPAWASAPPWASARHEAGMQPPACLRLLPAGRRSPNTACPQTCRQHLKGGRESVTPLLQWCPSPTWCGATGDTKRYRVESEDGNRVRQTMLLKGKDRETDVDILMIAY